MNQSKKLIIVFFALSLAVAACGKKKDETGPAPAAPVAPLATQATAVSAVKVTENQDGTISIELTVPDVNGVSTLHKGIVRLFHDDDLKSADGKSIVTVRQRENFGILMAVQYQVDSSVGRFYVAYRSQDKGYVVLVNGVRVQKNGALNDTYYILTRVMNLCRYNEAQAFAAMGEYFTQSPAASMENFLEAKNSELAASGSARVCKKADLATSPHVPPSPVIGNQPEPPLRPTPPPRPSRPAIPAPPEDRPVVVQRPSPAQYPSSQGQAADCPTPVVVTPIPTPRPPPIYQQAPPIYQQAPPVVVARPVSVSNVYHTDWQLCFESGKWKTDGNKYCKQTWWTNCSPESGGHQCQVSEVEEHGTFSKIFHSSSNSRGQIRYGEWTRDFNACYAAGAWQSNVNNDCRKESWPGCSPETNGEQCRPVLH